MDETSDHFEHIMNYFGLANYYPSKISLEDVMTVRDELQGNKYISPEKLPWHILQKLIMINYNGRDESIKLISTESTSGTKSSTRDEGNTSTVIKAMFSACHDALDDSDDEVSNQTQYHPLDIFVATYLCCDLMLRQTLAQKMAMCRLAVPLVLPKIKDDTLIYCLWAFRTILVEKKDTSQKVSEISVAANSIHIISFVRLGKLYSSKSKLLNNILDPKSHKTFVHHDCTNGNKHRLISNGLIEASWLIPCRTDDIFSSVIMFLNLRGDGEKLEDQLHIIDKVSNTVLLCIEASQLNNDSVNKTQLIISTFKQCDKVVLYFLVKDSEALANPNLRQNVKSFIAHFDTENRERFTPIFQFQKKSKKNAAEVIPEIKAILSKTLGNQKSKCLQDTEQIESMVHVHVDEMDEHCNMGKMKAEAVYKVAKGKSPIDCKKEMLPLQGEAWLEWTRLHKQQIRSGGKFNPSATRKEIEKLNDKMKTWQQRRVEHCQVLTSFTEHFVSALEQTIDTPSTLHFFLQWLKIYLDGKSRKTLPLCRSKYNECWDRYNSEKARKDLLEEEKKKSIKLLKNNLDVADRELSHASFGLEHLLREMGQIYEASHNECKHLELMRQNMIKNLPVIATKLLQLGYPIEIMDGDASYVPLQWVTTIFKTLHDSIGSKKVFVISLLGIQSSGKSTLLNTMFGLQFAVSAGRCTRGLYFQLVKVDGSIYPYEYVLVVDSEGLRAPEFGHSKHDHDNELATLAIGLGDVTLINIKGENTDDITDILQVAVHAFLRMKIAHNYSKLQQSCVFIHQNVSAVDAKEKLKRSCQKLQDCLDHCTKEAAWLENCAEINSFSDIIEFNWKDHVWYFSDLWEGMPPMAPVNPEYSESALQVKQCLMNEVAIKQDNLLTFSDRADLLRDLWKGILADDFVFSFCNSLAAKAYNMLERQYNIFTLYLEDGMMRQLEKAKIQLRNCASKIQLYEINQEELHDLEDTSSKHLTELREQLESFIDENSLKHIMVQWRAEKLSSLDNVYVELKSRTKNLMSQIRDNCTFDVSQQIERESHMNKIIKMATHIATNTDKPKSHLTDTFNKMWDDWVKQLPSSTNSSSPDITMAVKTLLLDLFAKDRNALIKELDMNPLSKALDETKLVGSIQSKDITGEYISVREIARDGLLHYQQIMTSLIDRTYRTIETKLEDYILRDSQFLDSYARNIIMIMIDDFENYNQESRKEDQPTLMANFQVKVAVQACRFAAQKFVFMQQKYDAEHSIQGKLQAYRNTTLNLFNNLVEKRQQEVVAADMICDQLEVLIKQTVKEKVSSMVYAELSKQFCTKFDIMSEMLKDLAEKDDFSGIHAYVTDAKTQAIKWIRCSVEEQFFKTDCETSKYANLAIGQVEDIVKSLQKGFKLTQNRLSLESTRTTYKWIALLREQMKDKLAIPPRAMYGLQSELDDFDNLKIFIDEKILEVKERICHFFEDIKPETVYWGEETPFNKIIEQRWKCSACCPLCSEPCCLTDEGHSVKHRCIQHRPKGIKGSYYHNASTQQVNKLVVENCNYIVNTNARFDCSVCSYECRKSGQCETTGTERVYHNYAEYQKYLPKWDISPSPTMDCSEYWMWVVATYKDEITQVNSRELCEIPRSWFDITKEQAINSLAKEKFVEEFTQENIAEDSDSDIAEDSDSDSDIYFDT